MNVASVIHIIIDEPELVVALANHGGVYACADKAGLEPATIYNWLAGRRMPRLEQWCRLMAVLGLDVPFVRQVEGI
jgi:DNA-binding phage protein